jgi:hypothetical protein
MCAPSDPHIHHRNHYDPHHHPTPHSFNVSVDAGNYVSLRAFLGQLGDKLQERFMDDSGDGDLPSVEEFLERLKAHRCVPRHLLKAGWGRPIRLRRSVGRSIDWVINV